MRKLPTKVKNFTLCLIFLLLIGELFVHCTYLFRDTSFRTGRLNILGFYYEKQDSLDAVFVGGSNVYRYWDCMKAWNEYGFTSYDYAVDGMLGATTIYAIEDIMKHQKPDVIVCDVRKMLSCAEDNEIDARFRKAIDAQDLNINRMKAIQYFSSLHNINLKEALPAYIDFIYYHNNLDALSTESNWKLMDNRVHQSIDQYHYKGFGIIGMHTMLDMDAYNSTENKGGIEVLEEKSEKVYRDLLEYCKQKEINLLPMCFPYVSADDSRINELRRIAEEYEFPFLDMNQYSETIGLDYSMDFLDKLHVNIVGADKCTKFLADYLVANYSLPDHRKDEAYASWNDTYQNYLIEAEAAEKQVMDSVVHRYETLDHEQIMTQITTVSEWLPMIDDKNMTVFIAKYSAISSTIPQMERILLKNYGLTSDVLSSSNSYAGVYCGDILFQSLLEEEYTGTVGSQRLDYLITAGETPRIVIDNRDYLIKPKDGIHMIIFDNHINEVVDSVIIKPSDKENGLLLEHIKY